MKDFLQRRSTRWAILALLCLVGALGAWQGMGWVQYVQSWIGAMFRAASGGFLFWVLSRYVGGLDLSKIAEERRPLAGLSQAILVGCGAIAVAVGV
jgi:hypothetical protein